MMNTDDFRKLKLDDLGTRYEHYSDLLSLWEESAEIMLGYATSSKHDTEKLALLRASIELMRNTLDGMAEYHDMMLALRRLVDYIPTMAKDIEGGRGTPLLGYGPEPYEGIG